MSRRGACSSFNETSQFLSFSTVVSLLPYQRSRISSYLHGLPTPRYHEPPRHALSNISTTTEIIVITTCNHIENPTEDNHPRYIYITSLSSPVLRYTTTLHHNQPFLPFPPSLRENEPARRQTPPITGSFLGLSLAPARPLPINTRLPSSPSAVPRRAASSDNVL